MLEFLVDAFSALLIRLSKVNFIRNNAVSIKIALFFAPMAIVSGFNHWLAGMVCNIFYLMTCIAVIKYLEIQTGIEYNSDRSQDSELFYRREVLRVLMMFILCIIFSIAFSNVNPSSLVNF